MSRVAKETEELNFVKFTGWGHNYRVLDIFQDIEGCKFFIGLQCLWYFLWWKLRGRVDNDDIICKSPLSEAIKVGGNCGGIWLAQFLVGIPLELVFDTGVASGVCRLGRLGIYGGRKNKGAESEN